MSHELRGDDVGADEVPIAWTSILEDTHVYTSDGQDLGEVYEVLGAEDIFHGLVVRGPKREVFVPADAVASISDRRIQLRLSADTAESLQPYQPSSSFKLGQTGLFGRQLSWVADENDHG